MVEIQLVSDRTEIQIQVCLDQNLSFWGYRSFEPDLVLGVMAPGCWPPLKPPSPVAAHHDSITGLALLPRSLHPHLATVFTCWVLALFPTDSPVLCEILIQVSLVPSPKHRQATRLLGGHQKASLQHDILTDPFPMTLNTPCPLFWLLCLSLSLK